jgi:hypothetical protein
MLMDVKKNVHGLLMSFKGKLLIIYIEPLSAMFCVAGAGLEWDFLR